MKRKSPGLFTGYAHERTVLGWKRRRVTRRELAEAYYLRAKHSDLVNSNCPAYIPKEHPKGNFKPLLRDDFSKTPPAVSSTDIVKILPGMEES